MRSESTSRVAGDGSFSFEEFVEIVFNMGANSSDNAPSADQEEKELRDAFRVSRKSRSKTCKTFDL